MPPHDLIGMVYFLHQAFFTMGIIIIIILIVTGAGFHSSDSTGRIPQPGLLSQDSTARIPQPGLHSTARIPQPGIHNQNSTTTIPQPGFHSWAPGVVTETPFGPIWSPSLGWWWWGVSKRRLLDTPPISSRGTLWRSFRAHLLGGAGEYLRGLLNAFPFCDVLLALLPFWGA